MNICIRAEPRQVSTAFLVTFHHQSIELYIHIYCRTRIDVCGQVIMIFAIVVQQRRSGHRRFIDTVSLFTFFQRCFIIQTWMLVYQNFNWKLPSLYEESTKHIHTLVLKIGLFPASDFCVSYHRVLLAQRTQALLPHFLGLTTTRLDYRVGPFSKEMGENSIKKHTTKLRIHSLLFPWGVARWQKIGGKLRVRGNCT